MGKLRLKMDDLQVESFKVQERSAQRGTVEARNTAVGGYCQTEAGSCACLTENQCVFPSTSCDETQTFDNYTCRCMYPDTDQRVCCDGGSAVPGAMC